MEAWVCQPSMLLLAAKYKHFGLNVNAIGLAKRMYAHHFTPPNSLALACAKQF